MMFVVTIQGVRDTRKTHELFIFGSNTQNIISLDVEWCVTNLCGCNKFACLFTIKHLDIIDTQKDISLCMYMYLCSFFVYFNM